MTTTIEPISSLAPVGRPVVVSFPLAGQVALALPVQHGGILYLAALSWRRGDPLETTDVLLDPEPPAHRDVLTVLDALEDTCKARASATPDPHNGVLWHQAAQWVWTYAADYGDTWAAERTPSADGDTWAAERAPSAALATV